MEDLRETSAMEWRGWSAAVRLVAGLLPVEGLYLLVEQLRGPEWDVLVGQAAVDRRLLQEQLAERGAELLGGPGSWPWPQDLPAAAPDDLSGLADGTA